MTDFESCRHHVWALGAVVVIGGLFFLGGKWIETDHRPQTATISVSGDGRAFVVPDIAKISVGVQTGRQTTAGAAMEKLKADMDKVLAAVKAAGVEQKDITTENFWLNPVYDYVDGRQIARGYEANQSVRVKIRNLDNVSAVLGAATDAGANQAGSVEFTVDDPDATRDAARAEAIAKAQKKADILANQLGVRLVNIIGFGEGYSGGVTPPMYLSRDAAYGMGGGSDSAVMEKAVALPVGEQEVTVNVTITYEVK